MAMTKVKFTETGARRLLKLARHLEAWKKSKKKGHKIFDFSKITDSRETGQCGSSGCAIGEMPVVFPKHTAYNGINFDSGYITIKLLGTKSKDFNAAKRFFELKAIDTHALFAPYMQDEIEHEDVGLTELSGMATPKAVAKNIRKFVKWKRKVTREQAK